MELLSNRSSDLRDTAAGLATVFLSFTAHLGTADRVASMLLRDPMMAEEPVISSGWQSEVSLHERS